MLVRVHPAETYPQLCWQSLALSII